MTRVPALGRDVYDFAPRWVAPPGVRDRECCHFRIRGCVPREAWGDGRLVIAAESRYALYVNGHHVGVGPARGVYTCNFADEYSVAGLLRDGQNVVAAEIYCDNIPSFTAAPSRPAVFIKAGDRVADESWDVRIADDWRGEGLPQYTLMIGYIEWHDWRRAPAGWMTGGDDSDWQPAEVIPADDALYRKTLFKRDVAMLRTTSLAPRGLDGVFVVPEPVDPGAVRVADVMADEPHAEYAYSIDIEGLRHRRPIVLFPPDHGDGVGFVVDFGQEFIGYFELDVAAESGTILDVGYEEQVDNGRLTTRRLNYQFADRHILRGGRHVIDNRLHPRGGRFMQLVFRHMTAPVTIHGLTLMDRRYAAEFVDFTCSDKSFNELWRRCRATMSACATDTFMDCPWREMSFWVNDFIVQHEYWLQLTGQRELIRRSFSLALSQPTAEGLVPGVCPTNGEDRHVLFATNLFLSIILRNYELHTDDRSYVDRLLPAVEDVFIRCQAYADADGMLTPPVRLWNFVDWSFDWSADVDPRRLSLKGRNACVVNAFNVLAAKALSELYADRDPEKARHYHDRFRTLTARLLAVFWNPRENRLREFTDDNLPGTQLSHALVLLTGLPDPEIVNGCLAALTSSDCLAPELYMMHFVLKALALHGCDDAIMTILRRYWMPMLATDVPTIWEANVHIHGKAGIDGALSLCHAFSLAPVSVMSQVILGVRPLDNGFRRLSFAPVSCGLTFAQGVIPTPHGPVSVSWQRRGSLLEGFLKLPSGVAAVTREGAVLDSGDHAFRFSCRSA